MTNSLPTTNWRLTIDAIRSKPQGFKKAGDVLRPQLCIADKMAEHIEDRRRLMAKRMEVVNDPADGLTEAEAARGLLKASVRMLKIRMYSRFEDAEVNRIPMETVGWTVLRFTATSRNGERVSVDLLVIIDTRTESGDDRIVTSTIV